MLTSKACVQLAGISECGHLRIALDLNGHRVSGRPLSRREQFEQIESDCLRPLPAIRHQMKERRSATVMRNSYVTFRLHHYSVPKEYIGKRVEIVYDADTLDIYHGLRLVTTHQRDDTPYAYTTKDAHGLPGRHGSYEKDLEQIYERAGQTDNVLLLYLRKVAELKKYPPAAFRSCKGSWHWRRPSDWNGWWQQAHAPRNCANTDIRK